MSKGKISKSLFMRGIIRHQIYLCKNSTPIFLSSSSSSSSSSSKETTHALPKWLIQEMRTNHAGEYGAVQIYNGAFYGLKIHAQINPFIDDHPIDKALSFVEKHKKAEQLHLIGIEALISNKRDKTSLIPLWHVSGFLLGFLPSIVGPRGYFYNLYQYYISLYLNFFFIIIFPPLKSLILDHRCSRVFC